MTQNNQAQTEITETSSVNPTIIIGLFIVIGSFFVLSTTLDSISSAFSWFYAGRYKEYIDQWQINSNSWLELCNQCVCQLGI